METTKALTPGQRAAATRAANRAGGMSPAKNGAAVSERAAGLALELWITEHDGDKAHLSIVFRAFDPDGRPMPEGLGKGERALPFLRWEAWPEARAPGRVRGLALFRGPRGCGRGRGGGSADAAPGQNGSARPRGVGG